MVCEICALNHSVYFNSQLAHRLLELDRVVQNKCIMAYDDTSGKMAKAFDAPLCNFNCYTGTCIRVVFLAVVLEGKHTFSSCCKKRTI